MPALFGPVAGRERRPGPPLWIHLLGKTVFGRLQQIFPDCRERRAQGFCLALELFQGRAKLGGLEVNLQGDAGHLILFDNL